MPARSDLGAWSEAAAELGLDHTALLRAPGTRRLAEEAHRVHELRRAAHGRLRELETLAMAARVQLDVATAEGLAVLSELHAELGRQTEVLRSALEGLERSFLATGDVGAAGPGAGAATAEELVDRHALADQFEATLDLLTMQGLYNPRNRTVQVQGAGEGNAVPMPPFERVMEAVLTDEVCAYLATADSLQLLLTPVADPRVISRVGKDIGFSDYTAVTKEDRGGATEFVDRLATADGQPVVEKLLSITPVPGLAAALYPEYRAAPAQVEGTGLSLLETKDRLRGQQSEAANHGVRARPMSPPEYMMLQALRQRDGAGLLDDADSSGGGTETWFPDLRLTGTNGTVVTRRMGHSVRFRLDQVGRGAENRGYRMMYAPAW